MARQLSLLEDLGPGERWALASALGYATSNVLTRVVSTGGDAIAGSVIRTLPMVLLGGIMMAARPSGGTALLPGRGQFEGFRAVWLLVILSLLVTPVGILALFLAFRYGGVLVAVPVFSINPLWGALIAIPFLGERFTRRIGAGMIAVFAGIALLTYGQHTGEPVSSDWPLGVLFALLTALSWAVAANFNRYLLARGLDVFWLQGITSFAATLVLVLVLAVRGGLGELAAYSSLEVIELVAAGGLSGLAGLMLSQAFRFGSVARVTTLKTLDVAVAAAAAVFLLGEALNWLVAGGIGLILAGVLVVMSSDRSSLPSPG